MFRQTGVGTNRKELPFKISIASPCPARWEDMGGDDRIRFCDQCSKNVYNISSMNVAEATALLQEKKGNMCARIFQRADGTVLMENCPVGLARHWARVKARVASGVAAVMFILICGTALGRNGRNDPNKAQLKARVTARIDDATWTVKGWFGIKQPPPAPARMGDIAIAFPVIPPVPPPVGTASTNK